MANDAKKHLDEAFSNYVELASTKLVISLVPDDRREVIREALHTAFESGYACGSICTLHQIESRMDDEIAAHRASHKNGDGKEDKTFFVDSRGGAA